MTNSSNQQYESDTALPENLRQQFMLIAQSAVEESGNASDECAVAAMMMADLLAVAAMLHEHNATCGRANEIVEFCRQQALPVLADAATEDNRVQLLSEATDRWSEDLQLLSPEERCSVSTAGNWHNSDEHNWGASLTGESCSGSFAPEETVEDVNINQHHAPFDMAGILASLAGEESPAAMIETLSGNAVSSDVECASSETPDELPTIDDPEMAAAFADDAQQCIAEMEASILAIETGQPAPESLRTFLRQLHTLKGASGTVGLHKLATFIHTIESDVEESTKKGIDTDRLLECVDAVRSQLHAYGISDAGGIPLIATESKPVATLSVPLPQATPIAATDGASTPQSSTVGSDNDLFVRVEASRLERLMDLLAELVMLRNRRETYVDSMRTIQRELNYCSARTRTLTSNIGVASPANRATFESPELETRQSHELHYYETSHPTEPLASRSRLLSRTLDEISKDTAELGRSLQDVSVPLAADNSAVSHLIGRFRQELMELRRLPIGGLFQRLQRVIRDAARTEGKLVEVHFEGQGARAERAVQDRLFEPLLHLVRNAVSHGINTPEERTRAGRNPVGRITLSAWSDASSLSIEVRDDGGGLNEDALESRGRECGLLPPGESVSRQQLWKLIFHPGFSTKTSVSEVSGRGVGMDVVDSWVKRLRGRIEIESERGKGTTFRLHVPLRSAVEHAMVVRAGGQLFALPMHAVSGTSNSARPMNGLTNVSKADKTIQLSHLLGCRSTDAAHGCFISLRTGSKVANKTQHDANSDLMIEVDAIVGVEEVVVRSLPTLLQRNELFAGVTLSGRAETVLLLDVRKVIELCGQHEPCDAVESSNDAVAGDSENTRAPLRSDRNTQCILVVDDSVVVRRSLSRKLQSAGFEVREATNGREALSILHATTVTAVITDLDMPGMSGLELLQEIKRQKNLQTIPVTVLTSRDDEFTLAEVRQLQPTVILNKPITDATFKAILESLKMSESVIS